MVKKVIVAINKDGKVRASSYLDGPAHDADWCCRYVMDGYTVRLMDHGDAVEAMKSQEPVIQEQSDG